MYLFNFINVFVHIEKRICSKFLNVFVQIKKCVFSNSRCISWNQIKNIFVWIRKVLIDIKNAFLYCTQINLFKSKNIYVHLRSRCGRESAGPCVLIGEAYLRRTGRKWEREGTKPEKECNTLKKSIPHEQCSLSTFYLILQVGGNLLTKYVRFTSSK